MFNIFNDSSEDFLEDLFSTNQPSGNPTFSSHPELTSPEVKDDIFDPEGINVLSEKLLDLDPTKYFHPPFHFDIDSDLKEIEFLLYQDKNYGLKDLIDKKIESDAENVYNDPFDSKGEKIKESKLLFDELDLPCDFLPSEYDSFISQDFSRVDALPSTNNEEKYLTQYSRKCKDSCRKILSSSLYFLSFIRESNGYDKNGTISKQKRTKPGTKQKAGKIQQSEVNKKSKPTKSKPKKSKSTGYSSCHNTPGGLRQIQAHLGLVKLALFPSLPYSVR
nr:hypothetical protein [Tanacetum cinerariifolium]